MKTLHKNILFEQYKMKFRLISILGLGSFGVILLFIKKLIKYYLLRKQKLSIIC
jgi:hypothetical protein